MLRVNIHARERQPRLFFNGVNLTVVENDLAILRVKNPESLKCRERIIWPACLPEQVSMILSHVLLTFLPGQKL